MVKNRKKVLMILKKEDVEIKIDDNVEFVSPNNVEGDQTPPPGDVLSDSMSIDSETKGQVGRRAFKAAIGTLTQESYATCTFPRSLVKISDSAYACDSFNDG